MKGRITHKQRTYARSLGISFEEPISPNELSKLIRQAERNAPNPGQLRAAREFGISVPPGMTGDQLKKLTDDEADKQGRQAIENNPNLKKDGRIYYQNVRCRITAVVKRRDRWVANLVEINSGKKRNGVSIFHLKDARAAD